MRTITLNILKKRRLNKSLYKRLHSCGELDPYNINVCRTRIQNEEGRESCAFDLTHSGNDPRSNKEILDHARCYYEDKVYTDEQWIQYLIPAVNEMLKYNDTFIRWYPGDIIKNKKSGKKAIVGYDYSTAYGGRDYTSLHIYSLDENGNIIGGWAWANYYDYIRVRKVIGLVKLRRYIKSHKSELNSIAPINPKLLKILLDE